MTEIGFIGLGNMGGPMVRNLLGAGHAVTAYDLAPGKLAAAVGDGARAAASVAEAAAAAEAVITMLPAGPEVREVFTGDGGVLHAARRGALLIDCSTIDLATARAVANAAASGHEMLDAPVSGGMAGAEAGTLTFMVGGSEAAFARARSIFESMGRTIVHAGEAGAGQAVKMCNQLMLAVSMIGVGEAFALAHKVGLDPRVMYDVCSTATSRSWALTDYCPEPGILEGAPSSRGYPAGFTAAMMLKDLRLVRAAAEGAGADAALGAQAAALYERYCEAGEGARDFSSIIRMIKGEV
jgi:3-hydroxyisobutyrate dehydrogenase